MKGLTVFRYTKMFKLAKAFETSQCDSHSLKNPS